MKSVFSKYGCPKCGKTTKIRWLPETYERWCISTPDELKDLHKKMPARINKSIPCHYCKAVIHTEPDETREHEDITNAQFKRN